jgi:hypothetical protein
VDVKLPAHIPNRRQDAILCDAIEGCAVQAPEDDAQQVVIEGIRHHPLGLFETLFSCQCLFNELQYNYTSRIEPISFIRLQYVKVKP